MLTLFSPHHHCLVVDLKCLTHFLDLVSTDWLLLEDFKKSNPIKVSEHASARKIDKESELNWRVPFVIKKREVIISKDTSRIRKTRHKHRIEALASLKDAADVDGRNESTFWMSQDQTSTSFRDT